MGQVFRERMHLLLDGECAATVFSVAYGWFTDCIFRLRPYVPQGGSHMATAVSATNLQRYALPEIEIERDPMGIISFMEDLVERVMTAHTKKSASIDADLRNMNREPEDELV